MILSQGEPETADAILRRAEAAAEARQPVSDEIVQREKELVVHYRLATGQELRGSFVLRVPDVGQRRLIAVTGASMRMGYPASAFGTDANAMIDAIAYLSATIREQDRPEWLGARGFDGLEDPRILYRLYEEALAHEARFLGAACDLRPSGSQG